MSMDLYKVLGVERSANGDEIKKKYHKMALRYHPDKNNSNKAEEMFKAVGEAYDILGDPSKRRDYDHGKGDSFATTRNSKKDVFRSFQTFFKSSKKGGIQNLVFVDQDLAINKTVYLNLEEISTGVMKKMKICRSVYTRQGFSHSEEKIVDLQVKSGTLDGTKIVFPKEGNRYPGRFPADIAFIIRQKPHNNFKRLGNDIIYLQKISSKAAKYGGIFNIPLLHAQPLPQKTRKLDLSGIHITDNFTIKLKKEELPYADAPHLKGDLVVKFEVVSLLSSVWGIFSQLFTLLSY